MRVDGLDDFINDLDDGIQRTPQILEACVNRISNRLLRSVKLLTPVDTGQARRSWRISKPSQFEAIVSNATNYIVHLEYGHRTRNGSVVDGRYMLKRSIEEIENIIGDELEIVIDRLW